MTTSLTAPTNAKTVEFTSIIDTTVEKLKQFHEAPDAFSTLTPPPIFAQIHRRDLNSLTDGEVEFTLWVGPIPVRWHAQHEPGPTEHSFADRMVSGPMRFWLHRHIFEETADGVKLIDRVSLAHKPGMTGIFTRLMFDGLPLRLFFFYRHLRTKLALR